MAQNWLSWGQKSQVHLGLEFNWPLSAVCCSGPLIQTSRLTSWISEIVHLSYQRDRQSFQSLPCSLLSLLCLSAAALWRSGLIGTSLECWYQPLNRSKREAYSVCSQCWKILGLAHTIREARRELLCHNSIHPITAVRHSMWPLLPESWFLISRPQCLGFWSWKLWSRLLYFTYKVLKKVPSETKS